MQSAQAGRVVREVPGSSAVPATIRKDALLETIRTERDPLKLGDAVVQFGELSRLVQGADQAGSLELLTIVLGNSVAGQMHWYPRIASAQVLRDRFLAISSPHLPVLKRTLESLQGAAAPADLETLAYARHAKHFLRLSNHSSWQARLLLRVPCFTKDAFRTAVRLDAIFRLAIRPAYPPHFRALLHRFSRDESPQTRAAAGFALARIGDERVLKRAEQILQRETDPIIGSVARFVAESNREALEYTREHWKVGANSATTRFRLMAAAEQEQRGL